jgi:hypothetical protein
MAVSFRFRTMAQQGHRPGLRQFLDQPECELLSMIPDHPVRPIGSPALEHLRLIAPRVDLPFDPSAQKTFKQRFARSEIRHPYVISLFPSSTAPEAGHQNAETVSFGINGGSDRFGSKHLFLEPCLKVSGPPSIDRSGRSRTPPVSAAPRRSGRPVGRCPDRLLGHFFLLDTAMHR